MIPAARFIEEARNLVGSPFLPGGRNSHGLDCIGLLYVAAANAGFDLCGTAGHREALVRFGPLMRTGRPPESGVDAFLDTFCSRVERVAPAVLVVMRSSEDSPPRHFAIAARLQDRETLIHVNDRRGVVEHGYVGAFVRNTHSRWRLPWIAYHEQEHAA